MNAVVRAFLFEYFLHSAYKVWAWEIFLLGAGLIFGPGILGVSLETLGSFVIVVVWVFFFPLSIIPSLKLPNNLPHLCIGLFLVTFSTLTGMPMQSFLDRRFNL